MGTKLSLPLDNTTPNWENVDMQCYLWCRKCKEYVWQNVDNKNCTQCSVELDEFSVIKRKLDELIASVEDIAITQKHSQLLATIKLARKFKKEE